MDSRKSIVVAWKKVCRPCVEGGLGLRDLRIQNEALLKKLAWNVLTEDSQVFRFLRARFFKDQYVPKMYKFSLPIWRGIKSHILQLHEESIWMIGRHSKVRFWVDNWLGSPLIEFVSGDVSLDPPNDSLVGEFVDQQVCRLPEAFCSQFPSVTHEIHQIIMRDWDTLIWRKLVELLLFPRLMYH